MNIYFIPESNRMSSQCTQHFLLQADKITSRNPDSEKEKKLLNKISSLLML